MHGLEKEVYGIVRADEEQKVVKGRADYEAAKVANPTGYYATQPFNEAQFRLTPDARDKLVKGLCQALFALTGEIVRGDVKGYSTQNGGQSYGGESRKLEEPCCNPVQRHGVYVDLGLSLMFQGHAGLRLSGAPSEVRSSKDSAPQFVRELCGSHYMTASVWDEVAALRKDDYEAFCSKYDALVAELEPAADKVAERHGRKLQKSRDRAARPDVVAKKEAEARLRARESLSKLLGSQCKGVLDSWSPEQLLSYLRLCQKHEYVLRELMRWSNMTPLGSKALGLEDVEASIEMAKVREVMES